MAIKGIIFDLWGTLIDNGVYSPLRQSYKIMMPEMEFSDFVVKMEQTVMTKKFKTLKDAFELLCKELKVEKENTMIEKLIGIWNSNSIMAKLYPETITALDDLKNMKIKLALVSNSMNLTTEQVIDKFNLKKYFDVIGLSYDLGFLKTSPKMYDYILKEFDLAKHEVLMVGDSMQTDISGAIMASIKPILVDRKNMRVFKDKISNLEELQKYIDKIK